MDYSLIERGGQYTCVFGADRFIGEVAEKGNGLLLMKVIRRTANPGHSVGLPDNAQLKSEMWLAPELVEPTPEGGATY
jgi:hypothetical protein